MAQQQHVADDAGAVMPEVHGVQAAQHARPAGLAHHQGEATHQQTGSGPGRDDRDGTPERQIFPEGPPYAGEA